MTVIFIIFKKPQANGKDGLTLDEARAIAESSVCPRKAVFTGAYLYNQETKIWRFEMDVSKKGCNSDCSVNEKTGSAVFGLSCPDDAGAF